MKRNVSVVRLIVAARTISGKIIKEMPISVASGTHCINEHVRTFITEQNEARGKEENKTSIYLLHI
jgi:hypothetical protein